MMKHLYIAKWIIIYLVTAPSAALSDGNRFDLPSAISDERAMDAFARYWQNFERYEERQLRQGMDRYQRGWSKLQEQHSMKERQAHHDKLDYLKRTIQTYKQHLQTHGDAQNRAYVLLNLAQVFHLKAQQLQDPAARLFAQQEALSSIQEIEQRHQSFSRMEDTLYLKAIVYGVMDQPEAALEVWRELAASESLSLYQVHAHIALGDHFFNRDDTTLALREYRAALALAKRIELDEEAYELSRINYRLAWAAYRATDLEAAIEAAMGLFRPGSEITSLTQREQMQQDAVDLIGDALYERNNMRITQRTLTRRELLEFSELIGSRVMQRYAANGIHAVVVQIGEFLFKEFPISGSLPEWLKITASSYQELSQRERYIETLERLALLLPKRSLWRAQHQNNYHLVTGMEERAEAATRLVAAHYYDHGMSTGNEASFLAAASFFRSLTEYAPQHESSLRWRLQHAHAHFFAERYEDAARHYKILRDQFSLPVEKLEVASYQLVLAQERIWRESFARSSEGGRSPLDDPVVLDRLSEFEISVNAFANRFPDTERAIDAALLAAAANRDHRRFDAARTYWQRTLLSEAAAAQRIIAIRGMVLASMEVGSRQDVIDTTSRFIQLEDWQASGQNIGRELHGVLSAAAAEESQRLNQAGEISEAGSLLVNIAQSYPDIPNRQQHFRDGAYMLAIAGEWRRAQQAADRYLEENLKDHAGDMAYLRARALEYQLRFRAAGDAYAALASNHPNHARAETGLKRAEHLALAEGLYSAAGAAADGAAAKASEVSEKLLHLTRAYGHFLQAEDYRAAMRIAANRRNTSRSQTDRLDSELMLARAQMLEGQESAAIERLEQVAQTTQRQQSALGDHFARLSGEANFALAEDDRREFRSITGATSRTDLVGLNQKISVFERMLTRYNRAIDSQDKTWGPKARYRAAVTSENLADDIARVLQSATSLDNPTRQRLRQLHRRLRDIAQRYHGTNLLASTRDPHNLAENPWIRRSEARIPSSQNSTRTEEMPASLSFDLPLNWSM